VQGKKKKPEKKENRRDRFLGHGRESDGVEELGSIGFPRNYRRMPTPNGDSKRAKKEKHGQTRYVPLYIWEGKSSHDTNRWTA